MAQGFFKNVNIIAEVNSSNKDSFVNFYTPGTESNAAITGIKYSGFITSLRMIIDIKSIAELILPTGDTATTQEELDAHVKQTITLAPKKCVEFYLKNNNVENPVKIGELWLFNRIPYYFVDLIRYFSSASTFDVAPETTLSVKFKNLGFGFLANTDKITIIGSVVEEASAYIE